MEQFRVEENESDKAKENMTFAECFSFFLFYVDYRVIELTAIAPVGLALIHSAVFHFIRYGLFSGRICLFDEQTRSYFPEPEIGPSFYVLMPKLCGFLLYAKVWRNIY